MRITRKEKQRIIVLFGKLFRALSINEMARINANYFGDNLCDTAAGMQNKKERLITVRIIKRLRRLASK